jgi:Fic family protein
MRTAAVQTGAIEGLYHASRGVTRAVALQAALWEAELDKIGPDVRGHFEAQLSALEIVLDAATRRTPVTEKWVRELHATTCAAQKTYKVWTSVGPQVHDFPHGRYKGEPNNVTLADGSTHWYAPVLDTPAEMHRFIEELRTPLFQGADPVLQAAFAHHALTYIHPFADGNGRVARAIASMFLYRSLGIPLVVFSDQQERYWDALAKADKFEPGPFVAFIEERGLDTMALVGDRLREAARPLEDQVARIRTRFTAHGGLTHAEINALALRVSQRLDEVLSEEVRNLGLPADVQAGLGSEPVRDCTFWGRPYHLVPGSQMLHLTLSARDLTSASVPASIVVGLSNRVDERYAFIAVDANGGYTAPLQLRVTDVHPFVAAAADALIHGWVRSLISTSLGNLQRAIDDALAQQGIEYVDGG